VGAERIFVFGVEGQSWRASSLALKRSSSIGGRVLADYSVVNIGFVAAEHVGSSVRIPFRPASITQ
jgi:hypothetical protein